MTATAELSTEAAEVLQVLRDTADTDVGGGWWDVYLDNASSKLKMPANTFRAYLAQLSQAGVYRVVDGYAWGSVKIEAE